MSGGYKGIDDAKTESRYPFLDAQGTHIVVITPGGWTGKETFAKGFCDICEMQIVKTITGDASGVGGTFSRIRSLRPGPGRDMSLMEVKTRVMVALSSAGQNDMPGFAFPASSVTQAVLDDHIEQSAGRKVAGYPIKVQVNQVKTKAGNPFTSVNYSVPTKADLEGLKLDAEGRVVG